MLHNIFGVLQPHYWLIHYTPGTGLLEQINCKPDYTNIWSRLMIGKPESAYTFNHIYIFYNAHCII